MFAYTSKLNWEGVRTAAEDFRSTIEKLTPSIYEEIVGIAEGAGLDVLDIVALNSRSEIALGLFSDGCTSFSWKNDDDGCGRVLAQNWDWVGTIKENLAMVSIEQEAKPKIYMVTEVRFFSPFSFFHPSSCKRNNLNEKRSANSCVYTGRYCWENRLQYRRRGNLPQCHPCKTSHKLQIAHPHCPTAISRQYVCGKCD